MQQYYSLDTTLSIHLNVQKLYEMHVTTFALPLPNTMALSIEPTKQLPIQLDHESLCLCSDRV